MAVSLKDVAAIAGVSIKTVSNVVNDYPFVSPATRSRVQSVITELGYRPNLTARRLRSGRSGLIALTLPEISSPYYAELADHLVQAAEARGLTVLIDNVGRGPAHAGRRPAPHTSAINGTAVNGTVNGSTTRTGLGAAARAAVRDNIVDATIASPLALSATDIEHLSRTHPLVLLGERTLHRSVDHVGIDSRAAAEAATAHLLTLGCRVVAAIGTGDRNGTAARLRFRGYQAALTAAGVPVDPGLCGDVRAYHRADGDAAMRELLARRPDIDGVFCFNDLLAIGALRALRESGRRMPRDVAVVGFDDVENCRYTAPPLTSIAPDKKAIAEAAVELVVRRTAAQGRPIEPREVFAPFALAVRESSGG